MKWLPEDIQYMEQTARGFTCGESFASFFLHATHYSWWPGCYPITSEKKRIREIELMLAGYEHERRIPCSAQHNKLDTIKELNTERTRLSSVIKRMASEYYCAVHAHPVCPEKQSRITCLTKLLSTWSGRACDRLQEAGFYFAKGSYIIYAMIDTRQGIIYDLSRELNKAISDSLRLHLENSLYQFPTVHEVMGMSGDEIEKKRRAYWERFSQKTLG